MGESRRARAGLIAQLANLDPYPESVPINHLVQVEGTPLHAKFHGDAALDPLEFVRTIAAARITMPEAMVRLSAGRREMGEAVQALCFLAGANSIFYGDRLLTTGNPDVAADRALFAKLGLAPLDLPRRVAGVETTLIARTHAALAARRAEGLFRHRTVLESPQGSRVRRGGTGVHRLREQRLPGTRERSRGRRGRARATPRRAGASAPAHRISSAGTSRRTRRSSGNWRRSCGRARTRAR